MDRTGSVSALALRLPVGFGQSGAQAEDERK